MSRREEGDTAAKSHEHGTCAIVVSNLQLLYPSRVFKMVEIGVTKSEKFFQEILGWSRICNFTIKKRIKKMVSSFTTQV